MQKLWVGGLSDAIKSIVAQKAYDIPNPHPVKILTDKISLKTNPADIQIAKSYINSSPVD
jgi:hypothetical protein